jgi:hypothetical protein
VVCRHNAAKPKTKQLSRAKLQAQLEKKRAALAKAQAQREAKATKVKGGHVCPDCHRYKHLPGETKQERREKHACGKKDKCRGLVGCPCPDVDWKRKVGHPDEYLAPEVAELENALANAPEVNQHQYDLSLKLSVLLCVSRFRIADRRRG